MLRNVIEGQSTQEIFKVGVEAKRGSVMVKNLTTKVAEKADGVGVEVYFLDRDFVPTGAFSDTEISEYTTEADTVKANEYGILRKIVSGTWATDQIDTSGLAVGDYLVAGTVDNVGKLVKGTAGVSVLKYVGAYDDGGKALHSFEVVEPHTIA